MSILEYRLDKNSSTTPVACLALRTMTSRTPLTDDKIRTPAFWNQMTVYVAGQASIDAVDPVLPRRPG